MSLTIYHNPRCSKSRATLAIIEEAGADVTVIDYLNDPPEPAALAELCRLLGLAPAALVRRGEAVFAERYADQELDDDGWLAAMQADPILIQRPIVSDGRQAVIGRPPEAVRQLLDD